MCHVDAQMCMPHVCTSAMPPDACQRALGIRTSAMHIRAIRTFDDCSMRFHALKLGVFLVGSRRFPTKTLCMVSRSTHSLPLVAHPRTPSSFEQRCTRLGRALLLPFAVLGAGLPQARRQSVLHHRAVLEAWRVKAVCGQHDWQRGRLWCLPQGVFAVCMRRCTRACACTPVHVWTLELAHTQIVHMPGDECALPGCQVALRQVSARLSCCCRRYCCCCMC